ncbi:hypothetical protein RVR_P22 (plasmid) [Actinacidiphila reveromycinica]|uniref:Uncharacterized protein n=1 Tax=Actinacidiphila reveromycinica TaxID=659352 RepID=A0A7R6QBQ3_9ACTN|nr:hypothetical protein [Streptomyces sp. SN-593]BBG20747.1 hypothetical protein RVR_P22 [Streptomyces sp. SN-593]
MTTHKKPPSGETPKPSEPGDLGRYRIVARRTDDTHPGATTLTHFTYARSAEEAIAKVRAQHEGPGCVYGEQGLYRVVEVTDEGPFHEVRQQEEARRRYLTTIMDHAKYTLRGGREVDNPHEGQLRLLNDFFTRAVVFPEPHDDGVRPQPHQATFGWTSERPFIEHSSDPGRALAVFLLAYLDHHGMALAPAGTPAASEIDLDTIEALHATADLPDEAPNVARPVEDRSSEGQRSAQREADEGSEAVPELIEQVSDLCEQHFAAVTGSSSEQWEAESREVVGIALRTVKLADRDAYPQVLEEYLNTNRARLERLWARYGPGGMFADEVVLVDFPACYVLCERIEADPLWLNWAWAQEDQEETALERLHDAWLYDTGDTDGGR